MSGFATEYKFCQCPEEKEIYPKGTDLDELDEIILSKFNLLNRSNISPSTGGGKKTPPPSLTIEVNVPEISPNVVTPDDYDNFNHKNFNDLKDHLTRVFTDIETITRCKFKEGSMWKITVENKKELDYNREGVNVILDPEKHFVWYYSNEAIRNKCSKNPNNPFKKVDVNKSFKKVDAKTTFKDDLIGLAALGYTNNGGKTKRKRKTKRKKSLYRKPKKRSKRSRNKIRKKSRNKKYFF